jgi:hypothetical protein
MERKQKQVVDRLKAKGYEPSEAIVDGRDVVEWSSSKSIYRIDFDSKGKVIYAEIDGDKMYQVTPFYDKDSTRSRWFVDGCLGAGMRFHTLEDFLGIDLFT